MEQKDVILMIDDTPANLIYILEFLTRKGFKVLVAQNGREGIDMAKLAHPDLILLDVIMPDMEGFQVCQHLKAQKETQDIPIIFMTALTEVANKVHGFKVGAADYITKPFNQEEILVRVNTHLNLSKLQQQLIQQNHALQQEVDLRKHTEETLRAVLEATTDVIMMLNQKGTCILINPKGASKLGMETHQIMNHSIDETFPQEFTAQIKSIMNKVMRDQQSELFEIEFNGLWFEINCDRIENGSGVVLYARDITGRKEISRALQLSQERYVLAVVAGKVGVWDWNAETQQFYCDTALGGKFPQSFQEWLDLVHPEDRERVLHTINYCLQEPTTYYEFEYRMFHKNGDLHWFIARGTVVYHQKRVYRLVGTTTDITEQKRMQETLSISHERFSTVLDSLEIGIYVVDLKTHQFLFTNQYFKETCQPTLQQNCWKAFYPHQETSCHFCINSQENRPTETHFWEVYHAESKKWFYGQSRIIRWMNGEWVGLEMITDITARKQAVESLQQSEKRFELAVRGANDGIWDYNLETHEVYYSPRWKQILGYAEDELSNQFEEMIGRLHQDDQASVLEKLHAYLEKKSPTYEATFRMQHQQGHYVWILARGMALWDDTGKALRMVGTHMDLTTQKQAEVHLAQLGQLTEELLKLPIIIFKITPQGTLIEAQGAGLDLLGVKSRQEVMGLDFFKVFPQTHQYVKLALANIPQHFSYTFAYKKRTVCYETFLTLDRREKNLIGIALDISDRMAAIDALREHEEYRHTLIREASIGLGLFENDLLVEANPTFARILGYSVEEIDAKQLHCYMQELTPPQYLAMDEEQKRLLEQKGRFGPYEKECFHQAGHLVPVRLSGVMIQYKQHYFLWTTLEDISDRKQVEEALREAKEVAEVANYTKTAFLANMSHELRTPLNGILGHTQLLVQDKALTSQHVESISIIQRNGEYLLTLIGDILDLSKIETQHLELFPTTFLFEKFIKEINEFTHTNAMQRGLTFYYQALTPLPKIVRTDEIRLRQVLINLLSNAIKFTKKGQIQLHVSALRKDEKGATRHPLGIRFQIEDTGIGISPENLSKIFTPFQQFGERNYRDRGTGLGLALSKRLVEMMGGTLHLESVLEQGTKVWVEIDLEEEGLVPEELSLMKGCTLLVVDEHDKNRIALIELLSPLNFEVVEANNAQEALEKAIQRTPDGILIDLTLLMRTECEAIEQIKQLSKLKTIPLIVCTDSLQDIHQSVEVIVRPFQREILLEKLQYCLKAKQLDERAVSLAPQSVRIEDFSSLVGPSSEEASQLLKLAKMGDVYGIFDFLERLEKKHPTLLPFIEKTRLLAKQFDHEVICEVARSYL